MYIFNGGTFIPGGMFINFQKGPPDPKSGDSFPEVFGNFYPILTKLGVKERMDHISILDTSIYQIFAI